MANYLFFDDIHSNWIKRLEDLELYLKRNSSSKRRYVIIAMNGDIAEKVPMNDDILSLLGEMKTNYVLKSENDRYFLYFYDPFETRDGIFIMCSEVNMTKLVESSKESLYVFLWSWTTFLVLVLLGALLFSRYLTKDIKRLQDVSKEVIGGNYNIQSDIDSVDEIGELAMNFDLMTKTIRSTVEGLNQEVEKSQKLFSTLTHEIKTPLTSIIGYADLLRKNEYEQELYQNGLLNIYKEGKRLSKLSSKLIRIIDMNKVALELKTISVNQLLSECLNIYEFGDKKSINYEVKGEDFGLRVDIEIIKNVILNILDNAVKSVDENGHITLTSHMEKDAAVIVIEDDGIGISESDIEHVFDPFFKADKSRSLNKDSLGMGLAIAKDIMEMHDGYIKVTSSMGEGTKVELRFTISLQEDDNLTINAL